METPEGSQPVVVDASHAVIKGMSENWPQLLGFNELKLKSNAHLIAKVGDYPLLSVMEVAKGRTLSWASDIGPHWCPSEFAEWSGYAQLWGNAIHWLAQK